MPNDHRVALASSLTCVDIRRPFSNFDYIDSQFGGVPAIRRIFSEARTFKAKSAIIEDLNSEGLVADENAEIRYMYPDYLMLDLKRVTFWRALFRNSNELPDEGNQEFIGYAIIKRDCIPSRRIDRFHVFESVMPRYRHENNCVPKCPEYEIAVGYRYYRTRGVLYCQQNGINKSCAHVALRSLLALHMPDDTILSYSALNIAARTVSGPVNPADGLSVPQIEKILTKFNVGHKSVDYSVMSLPERRKLPYQKFLYSGIESGSGALLGFRFAGPKATNEHHAIPFFGHTFNQDAWVSEADVSYFKVGEKTRYTPSEAWCSSFIGHDDNFGLNFCVPRLYVHPKQVEYVAELLQPKVNYSGVVAETAAVDYLYSIIREIKNHSNPWLKRLISYTSEQKVVLRAVSLGKAQYMEHLRNGMDWQRHQELPSLCNILEQIIPKVIWLVEVSLPQLFPGNLRKLGEIVLNATCEPSGKRDFSTFVFGRFPGLTMLLRRVMKGRPEFLAVPSKIVSHVPIFQHDKD